LSGLFTFPSTINWNTTDWHPDIFIQPGGGFWSQHGWDVFGAGASTLATILGNRQKQKQQAQVDPISAYMPMLMIGGMVTVLVVALVAGGKK
jgi:hypothetical protein